MNLINRQLPMVTNGQMQKCQDPEPTSTEASWKTATTGDVVRVKARPDYIAVIENDSYGRLTVRPISGQGVTTRARAIWRASILDVVSKHAGMR